MNQKLKNMLNVVAITNEQDILAIHGVVSDELKAQIEQTYPHLFEPKQYDFSDWEGFINNSNFPFMVGFAGVVDAEDRLKSLVIRPEYKMGIKINFYGNQILTFTKK
jgi:hypothetical protein